MGLKRKQIVVLSLVLLILIAGYVQYTYKKSSVATSDKGSGKLGEAVFVGNQDATAEVGNSAESEQVIKASKQANDYFAQTKLENEVALSKDQENLKGITEDINASRETKDKAYETMMTMIETSQKEKRIETLVKKIGFPDVIALMGEENSIDVIVKAPSLSTSQIGQITDIVVREAKINDASKIIIKNLF